MPRGLLGWPPQLSGPSSVMYIFHWAKSLQTVDGLPSSGLHMLAMHWGFLDTLAHLLVLVLVVPRNPIRPCTRPLANDSEGCCKSTCILGNRSEQTSSQLAPSVNITSCHGKAAKRVSQAFGSCRCTGTSQARGMPARRSLRRAGMLRGRRRRRSESPLSGARAWPSSGRLRRLLKPCASKLPSLLHVPGIPLPPFCCPAAQGSDIFIISPSPFHSALFFGPY